MRSWTPISLSNRASIRPEAPRLPDDVFVATEVISDDLRRSRADDFHQAIEHYRVDYEDIGRAIEAQPDPADRVLVWDEVRDDLPSLG